MTKLSVIIPAKNAEYTLERAVRSIHSDNHTVECIIVINNSTDNTVNLCKKLKEEIDNLIVIESSAKNISDARNMGLAHATGEIIGFCDADDYFVPNILDNILDEFINCNTDILVGGFTRINGSDGNTFTKPLTPGIKQIPQVRRDIINNPSVMGSVWNKLYRKNTLSNILFDVNLTHCEDMDFNLRILKNEDLKILYSSSIIYNYVFNANSITNDTEKTFDKNDELTYLSAINKMFETYANHKKIHKEIRYKIATLCIDNYSNDLSNTRKEKLHRHIKNNIKYLLLYAFKYEPKVNIDRLRKAFRILTRN